MAALFFCPGGYWKTPANQGQKKTLAFKNQQRLQGLRASRKEALLATVPGYSHFLICKTKCIYSGNEEVTAPR